MEIPNQTLCLLSLSSFTNTILLISDDTTTVPTPPFFISSGAAGTASNLHFTPSAVTPTPCFPDSTSALVDSHLSLHNRVPHLCRRPPPRCWHRPTVKLVELHEHRKHAAHLDLDTSTSSFSVYDGHGGFGSALNMETLVAAAERRNTPLETINAIFGTYLASQRFASSAAYHYA
ncbi:hypothetical protein ACSBR2_011689 [Camellia fascicularis]